MLTRRRGGISIFFHLHSRAHCGEKPQNVLAEVLTGQRFKVVDKDVTLEVTSIQQDTSLAKIVKGEGPLEKALRVEAT